MDWKHYVLALPIALFLLFLAFSFAGDTPEVVAEDEPVAAQELIDPLDIDSYVLGQDCDDDSSDEKGDEDGDEDSSDEDCPEEEEGEDDED
jgi:hypothetical protein